MSGVLYINCSGMLEPPGQSQILNFLEYVNHELTEVRIVSH